MAKDLEAEIQEALGESEPAPGTEALLGSEPRPKRGRPAGSGASSPSSSGSQRGSSVSEARGKRPQYRTKDQKLALMEEQVVALLALVGTGISMAAPVTGTTLLYRREKASAALMRVAAEDVRVFRALERLLAIGKWTAVAEVGAHLATAIAVDIQMLPPESAPVQALIPDVIAELSSQQEAFQDRVRAAAYAEAQSRVDGQGT